MSDRPLAIIPARGGSKRFPKKNKALLNGEPLVVHAIHVAKESGIFDCVCVSSDDLEILKLAKEAGADRTIVRPPELATDTAQTKDVCVNLLDFFISEGKEYDAFCILIPTSPLRIPQDLREAYTLFTKKKCDSVMSVVHCSHPPQQCVWIKQGVIQLYSDADSMRVRSQDLDPLYRHNGAFIFADSSNFLRKRKWYTSNTIPYIMPSNRSVDIDTPLDMQWAEFLLMHQKEEMVYNT